MKGLSTAMRNVVTGTPFCVYESRGSAVRRPISTTRFNTFATSFLHNLRPHGHAHDAVPAHWEPNRKPHPPSPPRARQTALPAAGVPAPPRAAGWPVQWPPQPAAGGVAASADSEDPAPTAAAADPPLLSPGGTEQWRATLLRP